MNSKKDRNIAIVIGILVSVPIVFTAVMHIVIVMAIAHSYGFYVLDNRNIPADAPIRQEWYVPFLDGLREWKQYDYTFMADSREEILRDKKIYDELYGILKNSDNLKMDIHTVCDLNEEYYGPLNIERHGDTTFPGYLKDEGHFRLIDLAMEETQNEDLSNKPVYDDIYNRSAQPSPPSLPSFMEEPSPMKDDALSEVFTTYIDGCHAYRITDGGNVLSIGKSATNGKTKYVMYIKQITWNSKVVKKKIQAVTNDAAGKLESLHIEEEIYIPEDWTVIKNITIDAHKMKAFRNPSLNSTGP